MKLILIAITTDCPSLFKQSLEHNYFHAGIHADLLIVDNGSVSAVTKRTITNYVSGLHAQSVELPSFMGLPNAMNVGLKIAMDAGYDYIQFCANNIIEDDGWLAVRISCAESHQHAGIIVAGNCGSIGEDQSIASATEKISSGQPFFSRKVAERIGFFNHYGGLSGPVLEDFSARAGAAGFHNLLAHNASMIINSPRHDQDCPEHDLTSHYLLTHAEHEANLRDYAVSQRLYRPYEIDDSRLQPTDIPGSIVPALS